MELQKTSFSEADIERLKENLKLTYTERFLKATSLYKAHMAAIKKATEDHCPNLSKYNFGACLIFN